MCYGFVLFVCGGLRGVGVRRSWYFEVFCVVWYYGWVGEYLEMGFYKSVKYRVLIGVVVVVVVVILVCGSNGGIGVVVFYWYFFYYFVCCWIEYNFCRVLVGSIERRLREDIRKIWNKRGEREFVVLMDEFIKVVDIIFESRI